MFEANMLHEVWHTPFICAFSAKNLAKSVDEAGLDLKILGESRQDNIKGYQLCLENMKHLINIALIDGSLAEY
jgi:hypothetical protein